MYRLQTLTFLREKSTHCALSTRIESGARSRAVKLTYNNGLFGVGVVYGMGFEDRTTNG